MFPGYPDLGNMAWMMIGWGLFWIALVGFAIFAIVRLGPRERGDEAVTILKERLARGEITPEEYQSRRTLVLGR
jgi:uncharacterized membrane protein